LVLDIIINFPQVPVSRLNLWTFGAPQVADEIFLESAMKAVPRLRSFFQSNGRFHRFVTLSDECKVDFVATVASRALPSHSRKFRGHLARTLGGLRGGAVHFSDPHYLFTPDQYGDTDDLSNNNNSSNRKAGATTNTRSALNAHSMINYVQGISRESSEHPLSTDLPFSIREELLGDDIR